MFFLYKWRLCYVLTSPCPGCFGTIALSTCPSAFSFPTTVMQHHNGNWHLHSACPCPFFCGFFTCRIIRHASASSLSFHDLGLWPGALEGGKGKHVMTPPCQLLLPNSLNPWTAVNYPICAVLTVGSKTQLWEANKRADLEKKNVFTAKDPEGLKGNI